MEQEEKYYYKPIKVGNFLSNNYMEYKSSGDKEYLDKIKPYLRDIIINIQKSDT